MRKALFVLVCIALCSGQMCAVPTVSNPQGILPGLYSGLVSHSYTGTGTDAQGQPEQVSGGFDLTITRNFGSHGGLLAVDGTPLGLGGHVTGTIGPMTMTFTVKGIQMNVDRLQMMSDVTANACDADGCFTFSGFASEVYTQVDPNTLDYQAEMNLGYTGQDGSSGMARYFYNGTLTK